MKQMKLGSSSLCFAVHVNVQEGGTNSDMIFYTDLWEIFSDRHCERNGLFADDFRPAEFFYSSLVHNLLALISLGALVFQSNQDAKYFRYRSSHVTSRVMSNRIVIFLFVQVEIRSTHMFSRLQTRNLFSMSLHGTYDTSRWKPISCKIKIF